MNKIALKLWIGMMSFIAVVLIIMWFFQIVFLEKFYTDIRISDIKNASRSFINQIQRDELQDIKSKLEEIAYNNNLTIEVVDINGNIVYVAEGQGKSSQLPMVMNSARNEVFKNALSGEETMLRLNHPRFNTDYILLGFPITSYNGALIVNFPLAPVNETASILKKQLVYIIGILLIVSIIISYIISRTFTKRILRITKVSYEIAAGNFNEKIDIKGNDEIGKLANTINNMAYELSKIEQLRKDLIANVSHELRTPLSLIRGYAETIRDVTGNVPLKREKQLEIIIEETERLNKIVNDILNLSQIQSGNYSLNKSKFLINKTIVGIVKKFEVLSEKTNVAVLVEKWDNIMVEGDETRIEQVFYNLINNAFNHTSEGGTISVSIEDMGYVLKISIADTGKGISEEDIKHIWDRFYKGDKTGHIKNCGTGLGLAIVKGIFEAHGLKYGVESREGVGTTFWFEIEWLR